MANDMKEIGRIGQNRWGGHFSEEFLTELQGRKGISVYKEMSENDDVIGSILYAIEMLIRQASWITQPGGPTAKDQEAADFIQSCMDDMSDTWTDTISEILSFLTYGWSAHELVYKRRNGKSRDPRLNSKYDDGLIGWMKLPIRAQETLWEWLYDNNDNLIGMAQLPPPDFGIIEIPVEKLLLFRTKSRKGNPEGRSILRNAYRCFDAETEILTRDGWKLGAQLTSEDELATLHPTNKALEYQHPIEIHRYSHKGQMLHFTSKFIDILVTQNHRMWVKKDGADDFDFVEAEYVKSSHSIMRFADWNGVERLSYHLSAFYVSQRFNGGTEGERMQYPAQDIAMDDWLAFLALFLTEGCATGGSGRQKVISISQKESEKANRMRELFARLPFHVYEHKAAGRDVIQFEFCNAQLYEELHPFGKAADKYVPDYVKELSPRQIGIFLDWYMFGDGMQVGNTKDGYRGTRTLGTVSARMADDLQELGLKAGFESQISVDRERTGALGKNPFYKVSLCGRRYHRVKHIDTEDYDGTVWCPTTGNGIVYVRRNGKPAWVGNCWYFKRRIQEIEGIGIERDLAGFPVLMAPEGMNVWDEEDPEMVSIRAGAEKIVQSIRRDSLEGLILPSGWVLQLLSTGGRRQFDTNSIIERYDTRIAMTVLADFVLLGHQKVGSFALSSDKTHLFSMAVGAYLDIICEAFNSKAIPSLIDLNGDHFSGITDYPILGHGDVEDVDTEKLATFVRDMTGAGVIIPDDGIEDYIREAAGLPERLEDNDTTRGTPQQKPKQSSSNVNPDKNEGDEDEDDPGAVEEAKKRLGIIK